MNKFLIVRLSSLGDIVQAIPVAAALREAFPSARIDWLVEPQYSELLEAVTVLDRVIQIDFRSASGRRDASRAIAGLRRSRYDCAIDVQGLWRSAVLARMSGAKHVIGFSFGSVREKGANIFYTETHDARAISPHIYRKNLSLLNTLGIRGNKILFPLSAPSSSVPGIIRERLNLPDHGKFALLAPGASWANKRWPAERFGQIALVLRDVHSIPSVILHGGEKEHHLSIAASNASRGAAKIAPQTTITDLIAVARSSAIVVSGDTAPLHIATSVGTPAVGLFGPTDPQRNSPLGAGDQVVSRYDQCQCKHQRRCKAQRMCIAEIPVDEVTRAIAVRLSSGIVGYPREQLQS